MFESLEKRVMLAETGVAGAYFNSANLSGEKVERIDANIDFDFGEDSPADGIDPTTYSVRWTGQLRITRAGRYTFYTRTDDGARLFVNNVRIINHFSKQTLKEYKATLTLRPPLVNLKMEYFNNDGTGEAHLLWSGPGIKKQLIPEEALVAPEIPPTPVGELKGPTNFRATATTDTTVTLAWSKPTGVAPTGYELFRGGTLIATRSATQLNYKDTGLTAKTAYHYEIKSIGPDNKRSDPRALTVTTKATPTPGPPTGIFGEYFNNNNLSGEPVLERLDPTVNFNFGSKSPADGINSDNFSVRWHGVITAPKSERYTFFANVDDGIRLTINGSSIISQGEARNFHRFSGSFKFVKDTAYPIEVEFIERTGNAQVQLQWSSPTTGLQTLPGRVLTPPADATAPAVPANFRATSMSDFSIQLNWDVVPGADVYTIQRSVTGTDSWFQVFVPVGSLSGILDATLDPDTTYYYRIRARNGAGDSDFSPVVFATTGGRIGG